jgi:uncharacterized protein YciI
MNFDQFSIVLLVLRSDAPDLGAAEAAALQDAHLDYLARLHEVDSLLAAGPLAGGDHNAFRGLSILKCPAGEARALAEADPAVVAGWFSVTVLPWMVPAGAMHFQPARFPHSAAEVSQADEPAGSG